VPVGLSYGIPTGTHSSGGHLKLNLGTQLSDQVGRRKGPPCTISVILAELDKDDRTALIEALTNPLVAHTTIFRVLNHNGFRVNLHTVQRHRRGECLCGAQ
jgi:hypothetical protein